MFRAYYIKNGGKDGYTCDYKTEIEVREELDRLINEHGLRFYEIEKEEKEIERKILNPSEWFVCFSYADRRDKYHKVIKDFNTESEIEEFRKATESGTGEWKDVWKTLFFHVHHINWDK